jgi:hypothetical protein
LLVKAGRQDLVAVIQRKSAGFQRHLDWLEETDAKGIVKRLDRRYLGGRLARLRAAFKDPQVAAQQIHERRRAGLGN